MKYFWLSPKFGPKMPRFCHDYVKNQTSTHLYLKIDMKLSLILENILILWISRFRVVCFKIWTLSLGFSVNCGYNQNFENDRLRLPFASLCSLNMKFQQIIFALNRIIQVLISLEFTLLHIIPKSLVTLHFFEVFDTSD